MRIPVVLLASFLSLGLASQADAAKALKSIGVTVGDLGNPFFVQIGKGATDMAKKLGGPNTKVTVVSSGYDLNTQLSQIETFIASKVDMIILNAADSKGIAPAVRKARAAGILVIAVDVGAEGGVNATVTSNNVQAGTQACEYITKQLGGKGNVVIINGPPVTAVIDRVKGCKAVFAKTPGIKVLSDNQNAGGSRDGGLTAGQNLLTTFPNIDAIFAINDPTGIGAELAAKQANRTKLFITAVDGAPDAEVALKASGALFKASAAQDPYTMAGQAVKVGYDVMQGKKLANTTVLIPTKLITAQNVATYKGWSSQFK